MTKLTLAQLKGLEKIIIRDIIILYGKRKIQYILRETLFDNLRRYVFDLLYKTNMNVLGNFSKRVQRTLATKGYDTKEVYRYLNCNNVFLKR